MAVRTYNRINHPSLGPTANSVLATLGPNEAKVKAVILADLAMAAICRGSYEQGDVLARSALDVTTSQEASIGADRLHSLHYVIKSQSNIAILAELEARLAARLPQRSGSTAHRVSSATQER
jgi:hypothetical protein